MKTKTCYRCGVLKPVEAFNKDNYRKDGVRGLCRQCQCDEIRDRRQQNRTKLRDLKESTPCVDCGISYPYYVMQYDHITNDKVTEINTLVKSAFTTWNKILEEIAKCELVCANCHAERTHKRRNEIQLDSPVNAEC